MERIMNHVNLPLAVLHSEAWKSSILTRIGGANIKVMRMNVKNVTDKDYWLSPYYLGSPRTVAFSVETKF